MEHRLACRVRGHRYKSQSAASRLNAPAGDTKENEAVEYRTRPEDSADQFRKLETVLDRR